MIGGITGLETGTMFHRDLEFDTSAAVREELDTLGSRQRGLVVLIRRTLQLNEECSTRDSVEHATAIEIDSADAWRDSGTIPQVVRERSGGAPAPHRDSPLNQGQSSVVESHHLKAPTGRGF